MNRLLKPAIFLLLLPAFTHCSGQTNAAQPDMKNKKPVHQKHVGGYCEGCERMYVGMPKNIGSVDTTAGWYEKGQKLLIRGTVFQSDGKTPAPDVVVYFYHTDNDGYYSPGPGFDQKAERHGHLRGWVKSDKNGRYAIYTLRPVSYPGSRNPAHIHPIVRESRLSNEYYIDDWVFDDDPFLTETERKRLPNRGGSGILKVTTQGDIQVAEHPIILGLNIPDYPAAQN